MFHDTIIANVALGREGGEAAVWDALEDAGATEFVKALPDGLETVVGEPGRALSGGQRQRLMVARALYARPTLLILDESTSGLDKKTEMKILSTIEKIKPGLAILAISHQQQIMNIADTAYHFADKRIIKEASDV